MNESVMSNKPPLLQPHRNPVYDNNLKEDKMYSLSAETTCRISLESGTYTGGRVATSVTRGNTEDWKFQSQQNFTDSVQTLELGDSVRSASTTYANIECPRELDAHFKRGSVDNIKTSYSIGRIVAVFSVILIVIITAVVLIFLFVVKEDNGSSQGQECCSIPEVVNGEIISYRSMQDQIKVTIKCTEGYRMDGSETITCKQAVWTPPPKCVRVKCGEFPIIENGFVNGTNNDFNSTAEVICGPGFVQEKDSNITCQTDGDWSPSTRCIKHEACDKCDTCQQDKLTGQLKCDLPVYFTETSVSREIGSNFNFTCILEGNSSSSGAIIYRNSRPNEAETLCNVSDTGLVTCGSERISGSAWPNENNLTTTFTIVSVKCEDKGSYFCRSVSNNSLQASMNLSVTKPPEGTPQLTVPARRVVRMPEHDKNINCSADVGYPAGDLQIQYSNDNSVTYKKLDIGFAEAPIEEKKSCSVTKRIAYKQYEYTESWNNTKIRCAVYYPYDAVTPFKTSEIQTITLITNTCPAVGDWYQYHPFNCHYFIACNSGFPHVAEHCKNNCPDIINNASEPHCKPDCPYIGC